MKLQIRGEKVEITDSMEKHVEKKLLKLDKYLENSDELKGRVLLRKVGPFKKLEITIPLKGTILRVEQQGEDFYALVDLVVNKLERQIRKNKTRLSSKKNNLKENFVLDFEEEDENEGQIIKRKTLELKPIDEEEAITQMELLNHDFYIFKNIENYKISVIYRRKNGDYGLIEEEI